MINCLSNLISDGSLACVLWRLLFDCLIFNILFFIHYLLYFHWMPMQLRCMRTPFALWTRSTAKRIAFFNFHISFVIYFLEFARVMAYPTALIAECHFFLEFNINVFLYGLFLRFCLPDQPDWRLIIVLLESLFDINYVSNNLIMKHFNLLNFFYFMLCFINHFGNRLFFAKQI